MSDHLPSFASGSNLRIRVGNRLIAYGSSLNFTDDVAHGAVGGIGSASYDANEPLSYLARGSFSLSLYSNVTMPNAGSKLSKPGRAAATAPTDYDGNSFLTANSFNPLFMMLQRSFDIVVYERNPDTTQGNANEVELFKILGVRLGDYALTFTPGSFIGENIGFMALQIVDAVGQPLTVEAAKLLQNVASTPPEA